MAAIAVSGRYERDSRSRAWIETTTTASVVLLAGIAAVVSYGHLYLLAVRHRQGGLASALIPLSVDGMIVAASMSLLLDSRVGRRGRVSR
jgi:ABC-type Fe3+ transport system permease subunit